MTGPVINPQREVDIAEVTDPLAFRDAMEMMARAKGRPPKVEVVIQVRGAVSTPSEVRRRFVLAHRATEVEGMPEEERVHRIGERVQEPDSREWEDAEVVATGRHDRVKLPEPGELDRVKRKTGAAEVRVAVRELRRD